MDVDPSNVSTDGNTTDASAALIPQVSKASRMAQKGGKRNRHQTLLIGIGGLVDLQKIDLRTSESRMAVLEALALAVAKGTTSALAASTLVNIVKESRTEAETEWEKIARRLANQVDAR